MNVRPLYDRIVVKRIDEQETTLNGIVIPDSAQEKPQQGEVIAIGRGKRLEDGNSRSHDYRECRRPDPFRASSPAARPKSTAPTFWIMREDDVLGVLSGDCQRKSRNAN